MEVDTTLLQQFLFWIIGGVGAGVIAYWLMENVAYLAGLDPKPKRYASLALAAALSTLAFAASVGLAYMPNPGDWQGWLEALFAVAFVAVGGSQLIHGAKKLS